MPTKKIIPITIAVQDSIVLDPTSLAPLSGNSLAQQIVFGDQVNFRFTLLEKQFLSDAFAVPGTSALEFIVGANVAAAEADIVAYSHEAVFDKDLWDGVFNRSKGKIACSCSFNTANLSTKLGDSATLKTIAELVMIPAGTDFHITLAQFSMVIQNDLYRIGANTPAALDLVPAALESSSSWSITTSSTSSLTSLSCLSESSAASTTSASTTSETSTTETSDHPATKSSSSSSQSSTSESSEHSSTTESTTSYSSTSESTQSNASTTSVSSSCSSSTQVTYSTSSTSLGLTSSSSSAFGFDTPLIDAYQSNLTAVWHLEESGTSNRVDAVGSNDGVPTGSIANAPGKSGNACDFEVSDNRRIEVPDSADISMTTGIAVSVWINPESNANNRFVIFKQNDYWIEINANDIAEFSIEQSDSSRKVAASSVSTVSPGSWYHIVGIAESGRVRVYVNNVEYVGQTFDDTIKDSPDDLYIGDEFDGLVDELCIWKNISFANDTDRNNFVDALYNSGSGRFYTP